MGLIRHRVIVQIHETQNDEKTKKSKLKSNEETIQASEQISTSQWRKQIISGQKNYKMLMEAPNDHTLLLSLQNMQTEQITNYRQMQFDCVGRMEDFHVSNEMTTMMDQLVMHFKNCCLIRVRPQRECELRYLTNLFVAEIVRRASEVRSYILMAKIEYCELRKHDLINVIAQRDAFTAKLHFSNQPHNVFGSLQGLRKWLQTEYFHLSSVDHGHECFELQLQILDSARRPHNVKLVLVQVYLDKLNVEDKIQLRNYLENAKYEGRTKHTMLTTFLKDFLSGSGSFYTWMQFDLSMPRLSAVVIDDLINLAKAAYTGSKMITENVVKVLKKEKKNIKNKFEHDSDVLVPLSSIMYQYEDQKKKFPDGRRLYATAPMEEINECYKKVDEGYLAVLNAMENYYGSKHGNCTRVPNSKNTHNETINVNHSKDEEYLAASRRVDRIKIETDTYREQLEYYFFQYKEAVTTFERDLTEILNKEYSKLLKIHITDTCHKLMNHALRLKETELRKHKSYLLKAIRKDIKTNNGFRRRGIF